MSRTKKSFNKVEKSILNEIYRRINYFKEGKLDEDLLLIAYPNESKSLVGLGILNSFSKIESGTLTWYNLTEKGQKFFSNYVLKEKLSEDMNHKLFIGEKTIDFNFNLLNS